MRTWNRKRKPKWCTKPKWKTKALPTSTIRPYILVARKMKNKFRYIKAYIGKTNYILFKIKEQDRHPKFKFVGRNRNLKRTCR